MKQVGRVIENLVNIGGYFSGWLVLFMMLIILIEVFMRYLVGQPPMVADEFAAYMLVAISFLGTAYTWKGKGHIRITVLVYKTPTWISNWLRLITLIISSAFTLILIHSTYSYLVFSFKFRMSSSTWIRFPLQIPQMTLLIGFILLFLIQTVDIASAIVRIRSYMSVEEKEL